MRDPTRARALGIRPLKSGTNLGRRARLQPRHIKSCALEGERVSVQRARLQPCHIKSCALEGERVSVRRARLQPCHIKSCAPEGEESLYEGHGFSRAIRAVPTTASAAEVRFSRHLGRSHFFPVLSLPQTIRKTYLRGQSPHPRGACGTAEAVPFVESFSAPLESSSDQPIAAGLNRLRKNSLI